jgi:putative PIN family toxin of toxin-antitoxin system
MITLSWQQRPESSHRPPIATLIDQYLIRDDFELVTAPELPAELDRVLAYPKLQRYYAEEDRTRFVALVMALSEGVELPETIPRICRDADDDRVIAYAVVGEADVIVTGDEDLLALEHAGAIPIVTAARFVVMLNSLGSTQNDH